MLRNAEKEMVKTPEAIEKMRTVGRLTANVLEALDAFIKPGVTTLEIDAFCERYIVETLKARPSSKGQYDFPFSVNTSPNAVVCHGIPSADKVLKSGDIINVDVTVEKDGYYGDSSKTYAVGLISAPTQRLLEVSQQCLYKAISSVRPGATLGDIGAVIQRHAEQNNYSVVREYCGHGIGRSMHEFPQVLHYGKPGTGVKLVPGMTFTIEPMINQGKRDIKQLNDGWTVVTKDRRLSAQWEHTVLVTENGCEVLTCRNEERDVFGLEH